MNSPRPSAPPYPALLQAQISHSAHFVRALRALHDEAATDDAAFLWLEGRAEEVTVFTSDVLLGWSSGELETSVAVRAIDDYLHALHASLEAWYGEWYAPSCCGPLAASPRSSARRRANSIARRRPGSLDDTMADVRAVDLTG